MEIWCQSVPLVLFLAVGNARQQKSIAPATVLLPGAPCLGWQRPRLGNFDVCARQSGRVTWRSCRTTYESFAVLLVATMSPLSPSAGFPWWQVCAQVHTLQSHRRDLFPLNKFLLSYHKWRPMPTDWTTKPLAQAAPVSLNSSWLWKRQWNEVFPGTELSIIIQ